MGPHIWDSSAQTCLLVSLPFFLLPFLLSSLPLPFLLSPTPAPPLVAQCTSAGQILTYLLTGRRIRSQRGSYTRCGGVRLSSHE